VVGLTFVFGVEKSTATTLFADRGAFDAAVGPTTTEGFETTSVGTLTLPFTFPSGLVVDLAAGDPEALVGSGDPFGYGFTNTTPGGENYLAFQLGLGSSYTVSFGLPATADAFGFDLSGFQPVEFGSGGFQAAFLLSGSLVFSATVSDSTDLTVDFWGFLSDTIFDEVQITIAGDNRSNDYVAFDEVSFNSEAVPEPATMLLPFCLESEHYIVRHEAVQKMRVGPSESACRS